MGENTNVAVGEIMYFLLSPDGLSKKNVENGGGGIGLGCACRVSRRKKVL